MIYQHQSKISVAHSKGNLSWYLWQIGFVWSWALQNTWVGATLLSPTLLEESIFVCTSFSQTGFMDTPSPKSNCIPYFLYVCVGKRDHSCLVSLKGHDLKKIETTVCTLFALIFYRKAKQSFKIQINFYIIFPFK